MIATIASDNTGMGAQAAEVIHTPPLFVATASSTG